MQLRESIRSLLNRNAADVTAKIRGDLTVIGATVRGTLLDLGCGAQPYRSLFPNVSLYIGADLPRERSANGLPKLSDVACSVDALPFVRASFDTVLCTQVLEHVPAPSRVLAEAARVLRGGGKLLITVPFVAAEHEEPHDYFRYTRYGMCALLEENGFESVTVHKQFGFWSAIGEMIYWHFHRKVARTWLEKYWYAVGVTLFMRAFHFLNWLDPDDKLALNLWIIARRSFSAQRPQPVEQQAAFAAR